MKLTRPSSTIVARWMLTLSLIAMPSLALGQKTKSAPAPASHPSARVAPERRRRGRSHPSGGATTANHGTTTTANHGAATANHGTDNHGQPWHHDDGQSRHDDHDQPWYDNDDRQSRRDDHGQPWYDNDNRQSRHNDDHCQQRRDDHCWQNDDRNNR